MAGGLTFMYYYKKGGSRINSYDVCDCYKWMLKRQYIIDDFITPEQRIPIAGPLADCYTIVMKSSSYDSGQRFRVHIKSKEKK